MLKVPARTKHCSETCMVERDLLIKYGRCGCGKEVDKHFSPIVEDELYGLILKELDREGMQWDRVAKLRFEVEANKIYPIYFE